MKLRKSLSRYIVVIVSILLLHPAWADTVITSNGSSIAGLVKTVTADSVTLKTDFAGEIVIDRLQISRLITESPLILKLADGSVLTATAEIIDGHLLIKNDTLNTSLTSDQLLAAWVPGASPPDTANDMPGRRWQFSIAADITGKRGNSDESGTRIQTEAVLPGNDEIRIYTLMDQGKNNGQKTSDEIIVGSSFVTYLPDDPWGWFIKAELERDRFENIDLRATTSTGLSYRVFNKPDHTLELQTGIGYRHESFVDGTEDGTPTLDTGLKHTLSFTSWLEMTNSLSFTPSLSDLGDYLLVHDSGLNMPIGRVDLTLRLGIKNNYDNDPAAGRERLDTIYYSRLLFKFD